MRRLARFLAIVLCPALAQAADTECIANPKRVGACRVVHGRFSLWQGFPPARIWVVGTKKYIGLLRDSGIDDTPTYLERQAFWDNNIYGDFYVCTILDEPPAGHMESACLQTGRNLVLEKGRNEAVRPVKKIPDGPAPKWPEEPK